MHPIFTVKVSNFSTASGIFKFPNLGAIVVGDFNCVPDVTLDKWGGDDSFGNKAVTRFHAFTESLQLQNFTVFLSPQVACILALTDRILLAAV